MWILPACAEELEQLSRVADTVVQAAPDVEPPMGFEVRLFERMGVADVRPRTATASAPLSVGARGVAVAAAALALGLGLSLSSSPAPTVAAQHAKGDRWCRPDLKSRTVKRSGTSRLRRRPPMDLHDAGRFDGHGHRAVHRRDRRRGHAPRWGRSWRARATGPWIAPLHVKPEGRAKRRGRVAQRDGDRHRHAGLTQPLPSTGRCRACRGPRQARRCSRPAPG